MTSVPRAQPQSPEAYEGDPVEIVLAYHNGDVHAAIMKLLEDCQHLRQQLAVTEFAMSRGLTRGWRPTFERIECEKPTE